MARGITRVEPFRIIGNIYFVGTVEASSHLIDTGDGLILIDTGYEGNAETIVESMRTLGFDIKDVKMILHSHGHYDHTDATENLLRLVPTAKTYLAFRDIRYVKGFYPDCDIKDGDIIELGNTKIECWFTPGHTEGSVSFFLDVVEDGQTYHAAMFGGSGVKQLKKAFMNDWRVPYLCRGMFFDSVERLLRRKVDVMLGNHTWQNHTLEKHEQMKDAEINPFIDPTEWEKYLNRLYTLLQKVIEEETRTQFVNYAVGFENGLKNLRKAIEKGANGVETEVQKTKDGALVLAYDGMMDKQGKVCDYTYEELQSLCRKTGGFADGVLSLESFLQNFANEELIFVITLGADGIEKGVVDLLRNYGVDKKAMIASRRISRLKKLKKYSPYAHVAYLTRRVDEKRINRLVGLEVDEIRVHASSVTAEDIKRLHRIGFNVCAWGTLDREKAQELCGAGIDGITFNALEEPWYTLENNA